MKNLRILGKIIEKNVENKTVVKKIYATSSADMYRKVIAGRAFLTYNQLEILTKLFGISVDTLIDGDKDYCEKILPIVTGSLPTPTAERPSQI